MFAALLSQHAIGDVGLYLCFLLGQFLFILKRAASAIRNPVNPIKSRRQFIRANLDVLSIRAALEGLIIYYPWRHIALATILGWFHIDATSGWPSEIIGTGIANGLVAAIGLGYASDSALDGLSQWSKLPAWLSRWMKENIPPVPASLAQTSATDIRAMGQKSSAGIAADKENIPTVKP
jgi:hypothetical protein